MDRRPKDPEIIVVSSTIAYRRLAARRVLPEDAVLEIGCSTGGATRKLAATGARVVAVDNSLEFSGQLRAEMAGHRNVTVATADARSIPALRQLMPDPTVIFLDISGRAPLDALALQLRLCLRAFDPRLVVVRNYELAHLASLIGIVEPPAKSDLRPAKDDPVRVSPIQPLLDLASSQLPAARLVAVRRLRRFADPAVIARLGELSTDPHPKVRRAAILARQHLEDILSKPRPKAE